MTSRVGLACALALLCGCADSGKYVWAQDFQAPPPAKELVLQAGDVVQVRVYGQEAVTSKVKVRSDGQITLPLLGDVAAAGYPPSVLGQQLEVRFRDFFKAPLVSVAIEESSPLLIPVAGEVKEQGVVSAERSATLLRVLLLAGGLTDFAHKDRIFVLRAGTPTVRIGFRWESIIRAQPPADTFELKQGDAVVVE